MLIHDYRGYETAYQYAGFISTLMWYRMYCAGKLGERKADYVKGFKKVKLAYSNLWEFKSMRLPDWQERPIISLFDAVQAIRESRRIVDARIEQISALIEDFQENHERDFRLSYIE